MSRTVYVVRRLSWGSDSEDDICFSPTGEERVGVPVRVFFDRDAADAFCRDREASARHAVPPGRAVGYELPEPDEFADGVRELGLTPPESEYDDYLYGDEILRWWETVAADATPEQRAGVWELLKDVRFYDVVETTLED